MLAYLQAMRVHSGGGGSFLFEQNVHVTKGHLEKRVERKNGKCNFIAKQFEEKSSEEREDSYASYTVGWGTHVDRGAPGIGLKLKRTRGMTETYDGKGRNA